MPKFHLAKKGNGFIPADTESQIKAHKISQGEVIQCRSIDKRNYEHHKKFFALIQLCFENLPEKYADHFPKQEHLREELIKLAGWKEHHKDFHGIDQYKAKSIAFDKMGQEEFEKLYSAVLDLVCRLIGIDGDDILDELMHFM